MIKDRLRIGWLGFHQEGLSALEAVLHSGYEIAGIVTLDDESIVKRSGWADYSFIASKYQVPLYKIKNINDPASIEILKRMQLDLMFVIGWSQIVRKEALSQSKHGMVGAHASLLPKYRGSAPVNWAIIKDEQKTGNSLIWLNVDVDEGDIIDQRSFEITPYDTCASVYERVAQTNQEMIINLCSEMRNGHFPRKPQTGLGTTVLPRRKPEDGLLDWNGSALEVFNFVRALTMPYPGAFSFLKNRKWFIWECVLMPEGISSDQPAGSLIGPVYSPNEGACGLAVQCREGIVVLLKIEDDRGNVIKGVTLSSLNWQGDVWGNE